MDYFGEEFVGEIPSIAPDLMFTGEYQPASPVNEPKVLSQVDRDAILQFVFSDHAYAKPYPVLSVSDEKGMKPMTVLKLHPNDFLDRDNSQGSFADSDDDIDVETVDQLDDLVCYDKKKAHNVMQEVELYLHSLWKDVDKDDVEKISRTNWSKEQSRLFDTINRIINNYQLGKLAYSMNINEPVLRKLALEKATKRFRKSFGSVMWNSKVLVWLHGIMIDGLGSSLFLCYLEILQSLKRKVPALFERVFLNNKGAAEKEVTAGLPNLGARLRKTWEPSIDLQTKVVMHNFPTTPSLILIPSGPSVPHQSTKRNRYWNNQLMRFGKVYPVSAPAYRTPEGYVIKYYLEHCISVVRKNISECRNRFPERHVILIGWGIGSLIACKISTLDKVDAVVCLGFPCNGIDGDISEEYWDAFTKIDCPILFYIGTHALSNSVQKTEELRERMKTQTNLIVIESADELLRLTKSQKRVLGMTQNMIDRLIQDQIYLFLKNTLYKRKVVSMPPKSNTSPKKRKKKMVGNDTASKKKKKSIKAPPISEKSNMQLSMDIPTSQEPTNGAAPILQGLLTTGSISTTIPVTQMHSEALISPTITVTSTDKPTFKSALKKSKEKSVKSKKQTKNFTAHLGTQKSGNLSGQCFSSSELPKSSLNQVTFQRVPNGSFVLSGASGHLRLQGGTNIVYLQQASSGATQLIHTPLVANSSGTFTAVLSTTIAGSSATSFSFVPSTGSQKNFNQGRIVSSSVSKSITGCCVVSTSSNVISTSKPASVKTSTIMTHLSANDLRYLANLIAKHSANQPNFSLNPSVSNKYLASQNPLPIKSSNLDPNGSCKGIMTSSIVTAATDMKNTSSPTLSQHVTTAHQDKPSILKHVTTAHQDKPSILKTSRISTDGISRSTISVIPSKVIPSATTKTGQKIPVTLTIPMSRLQTTISNSLSKSISVPGLSAYLAQQKFVLTSTKAGLVNRAVLLSPGMVKRESLVSSPLSSIKSVSSTNTSKTLPSTSKTLPSTYVSSKPTGTITLHLPTQNMKDQAALRKAAADIKLVGLLSEQAKKNVKPSIAMKYGQLRNVPASSLLNPNENITKIAIKEQTAQSICKTVFSAPKSTVNTHNVPSVLMAKNKQFQDESDVDFAVAPSTSQSSYILNKAVTMVTAPKYLDDVINTNFEETFERAFSVSLAVKSNSKNTVESSKMQETINEVDCNKLSSAVKPSEHQSQSFNSKFKFDSLKVGTNRSKLTSVLSSMKESVKVVMDGNMDENSKMRKPIVVSSKQVDGITKACSHESHQETDRNVTHVNYPTLKTPFVSVMSDSKHPVTTLSSLQNSLPKSVMISSPKASSESKKVLPVTIKTSDFVRMSSLGRGEVTVNSVMKSPLKTAQSRNSLEAASVQQPPRETKSSLSLKETPKAKNLEEEKSSPYVTRSGRVLKNRYPYSDDHDKKITPRKRRRTLSASKDDPPPEKSLKNSETLQMSPTVKLDSLVEAANLIKDKNEPVSNGKGSETELQTNEECFESEPSSSHMDSTTSIAANAMLELLTGETKCTDLQSDKDEWVEPLIAKARSGGNDSDIDNNKTIFNNPANEKVTQKEVESSNEAASNRIEGE